MTAVTVSTCQSCQWNVINLKHQQSKINVVKCSDLCAFVDGRGNYYPWPFWGLYASVASTWFGLHHARLKVVVLQPTVSFGCFVLWSSFSSASFSKLPSTVYRDPAPKDPVDTLLSHTKVSKKIYECIMNEKASIPSRSQGKWLEERDIHCNVSIIVNWENTNCLSSLCTRESKKNRHSNSARPILIVIGSEWHKLNQVAKFACNKAGHWRAQYPNTWQSFPTVND